MAALDNPRWETFAQLTATGATRFDAYLDAGFHVKSDRGAAYQKKVAGDRGTQLFGKPEVKRRVAEIEELLRTSALEASMVDRKYVVKNLKENSERAQATREFRDKTGKKTGKLKADLPASNRALELLGKEQGMFKDTLDITGLDEKVANMTALEVRAAIRAAATDVGLRMVDMDDTALRHFILTNAPRVGLRCVEAGAADHGSGQASEDGELPALPEATGVPQSRTH